jgi:8-oxo-dGTP pyrophosphatase MutT (NUDIX family)
MSTTNFDPRTPPAGHAVSYGIVLVDTTRAQVLLRKPSGGFQGYAWTFAKGQPDPDESPEDTAIREAREEYGRLVRVIAPIPEWFGGTQWANAFWLAEDAGVYPPGFDWETEATQWFTWDAAVAALAETRVAYRRDRDLQILAAAKAVCFAIPLS